MVSATAERVARVGDVQLAYETFGEPGDPAMLMIMGLGSQMIFWPEGLLEQLVGGGYFVIRFDNRDAGRSTRFDEAGTPSLTRILEGHVDEAPYRLDDMAGDAAGLLDVLGIDAAHLVGISQGGMIAQALAIGRPERVLSLACLMSSTGDRNVGQPHPEGLQALMWRPGTDRDAYIEDFVGARRLIASHGMPPDEAATRRLAERAYERGPSADGTLRQLAAILASGDRTPALRRLDVPTVAIHGELDPLIDVSGGKAIAAAVPGARLVLLPELGHDLPPQAWPTMVAVITENAERAQGRG
jgi:pimeloyl-ACP methyl ester carboxylesterase